MFLTKLLIIILLALWPVFTTELQNIRKDSSPLFAKECSLIIVSSSLSITSEHFNSIGFIKTASTLELRLFDYTSYITNDTDLLDDEYEEGEDDESENKNVTRPKFFYNRLNFKPCESVIFISQLFEVQGIVGQEWILSYLQSTKNLMENPDFIILPNYEDSFADIDTKNKDFLPEFFSALPFIHITSIYLLASSQQEENCKFINCRYYKNTDNINKIEKINMNGQTVQVLRPYLQEFSTELGLNPNSLNGQKDLKREINCDNLGIQFIGTDVLCTVQLLKKILNFTTIFDQKRVSRRAAKTFLKLEINKKNSNSSALLKAMYQYDIDNWHATNVYTSESSFPLTRISFIPQGWFKDPLAFMLLLDKWDLNQKALLQPYDVPTWTLILLCIPTLSIFLALSLKPNKGNKRRSIFLKMEDVLIATMDFVLLVLGTIIEQNPQEKLCRNIRASSLSFRILFGSWLLVSLVISNGYTGIVISFLCSTLLPSNLPVSFEDLKNSDYPTLSVNEIYFSQMSKMMHMSKLLVFEYFMETEKLPNYKKYYFDLMMKTYHLHNFTNDKLLFAFINKFAITNKERVSVGRNERNTALKEKDEWKVPKTFALTSRQSSVKRFAKMAKKMGRNIVSWMPKESFEILAIQASYATVRNYFSILLHKYVHIIVEAGLPLLWDMKLNALKEKWDWEEFECWHSTYNNKDRDTISLEMFNKFDGTSLCHTDLNYKHNHSNLSYATGTGSGGNSGDQQPLGMMVLGSAFNLIVYQVVLSVLLLLLEFFEKFMECMKDRKRGQSEFMQAGVWPTW